LSWATATTHNANIRAGRFQELSDTTDERGHFLRSEITVRRRRTNRIKNLAELRFRDSLGFLMRGIQREAGVRCDAKSVVAGL
jgi:hypothetical protein